MRRTFWKTREGKILDVDCMTESHAKNTLKMIINAYGLGPSEEETMKVINACLIDEAPIEIFSYSSKYNNV